VARPALGKGATLSRAIESFTGKAPDPGVLEKFRRYLALLIAWNRTHRLTGARSESSITRGLFVDSLLFLQELPPGPLSLVDIGTGPGIPGVPIRIVRPEISLTLIDSRRKQVSFLESLKRELDLPDLMIFEGRAEQLVAEYPSLAKAYDVVVTRAVGRQILPTVARYLKSDGLFISGGPPAPIDEVPSGPLRTEWKTVANLGVRRTFLLGRFG